MSFVRVQVKLWVMTGIRFQVRVRFEARVRFSLG